MSELPVLKAREVIRALERAGFYRVRQSGSHVQLKKGNLLVTVPVHRRDVRAGVLRSILRQARLTPEQFGELL
jgi:predicted RNA binding protein YcfA (HicA-like mRNA interferase family)